MRKHLIQQRRGSTYQHYSPTTFWNAITWKHVECNGFNKVDSVRHDQIKKSYINFINTYCPGRNRPSPIIPGQTSTFRQNKTIICSWNFCFKAALVRKRNRPSPIIPGQTSTFRQYKTIICSPNFCFKAALVRKRLLCCDNANQNTSELGARYVSAFYWAGVQLNKLFVQPLRIVSSFINMMKHETNQKQWNGFESTMYTAVPYDTINVTLHEVWI